MVFLFTVFSGNTQMGVCFASDVFSSDVKH